MTGTECFLHRTSEVSFDSETNESIYIIIKECQPFQIYSKAPGRFKLNVGETT